MSLSASGQAAAIQSSAHDRLEKGPPANFFRRLLRDPLLTVANSHRALAGALALILSAGTLSHSILENSSFGDALWWAVVTASTVGYGDISPSTVPGRTIAGLMIAAMVLLIVPLVTAQILSRLVRDDNAFTHNEQEQLKVASFAARDELVLLRSELKEVRELLRSSLLAPDKDPLE